jgi:FkbM family methyltransferase
MEYVKMKINGGKSSLIKPALRPMSRALLWWMFVKSFRGVSFKAQLNIFLSALIDTLFYDLSGWTYNPRTLFSGTYLVKPYGFLVYTRGGTEDLYHALPKREGDVHDFIVNALRPGDVFIDVGANIGYYSILASKLVGVNGKVFAVEPIPSTVEVLRFNIRINSLRNVVVIDKAGYFSHGRLKMSIPFNEFGSASIFRKGGLEVYVEAIPLDDAFHDIPYVRLLKVDVEGSEYEVLQGLNKTLNNTEYVVLELSREAHDCLKLLRQHGFKCRKMKFSGYYTCCRDACRR